MNHSRIAIATFVGFFVYYTYGFLVEGFLIRDHFKPYAAVYRSAETVMSYMPIGLLSTLLALFITVVIYVRGYEGTSGFAEAAHFGLLVGIFVACVFVGANYVTLNIGAKLAAELALSTFLQWFVTCVVMGIIYKR